MWNLIPLGAYMQSVVMIDNEFIYAFSELFYGWLGKFLELEARESSKVEKLLESFNFSYWWKWT